MAKKYVMVRMPEDVHQRFMQIKAEMERDVNKFNNIGKISSKVIKLPKSQVLRAIIFPEYNLNYIRVPLKKLSELGSKK